MVDGKQLNGKWDSELARLSTYGAQEMVNYEKEGDLEIHLADVGGYHQRYPDELGSVELPG